MCLSSDMSTYALKITTLPGLAVAKVVLNHILLLSLPARMQQDIFKE